MAKQLVVATYDMDDDGGDQLECFPVSRRLTLVVGGAGGAGGSVSPGARAQQQQQEQPAPLSPPGHTSTSKPLPPAATPDADHSPSDKKAAKKIKSEKKSDKSERKEKKSQDKKKRKDKGGGGSD